MPHAAGVGYVSTVLSLGNCVAVDFEEGDRPVDLVLDSLSGWLRGNPQFQVLRAVVVAYAVLVVDVLKLAKRAAKLLLHHMAVLGNHLAVHPYFFVPARLVRIFSLFAASNASAGARAILAKLEMRFFREEFSVALRTREFNSSLAAFLRAVAHHVAGSLKLGTAFFAVPFLRNGRQSQPLIPNLAARSRASDAPIFMGSRADILLRANLAVLLNPLAVRLHALFATPLLVVALARAGDVCFYARGKFLIAICAFHRVFPCGLQYLNCTATIQELQIGASDTCNSLIGDEYARLR